MFYESSFSSIKNIPFKYRFAIIVARRVYRQIGRKIIKTRNIENYEKSGKIYVNNFGKKLSKYFLFGAAFMEGLPEKIIFIIYLVQPQG